MPTLGDRGVIALHIMFLVSYTFFNKCIYFSYYMAGFLLDRRRIHFMDKEMKSS